MKRVESIIAERRAQHKPSTQKNDSAPNWIVSTVKEADNEDSTSKKEVSTVKENATDSKDPEKIQSDDSDAIGELDVSDDAGRENTPAY